MTKEELMSRAQYLDVYDIMKMYDCGKNQAYAKIREIKAVSDIFKVRGKVTVTDYERWYNGDTQP